MPLHRGQKAPSGPMVRGRFPRTVLTGVPRRLLQRRPEDLGLLADVPRRVPLGYGEQVLVRRRVPVLPQLPDVDDLSGQRRKDVYLVRQVAGFLHRMRHHDHASARGAVDGTKEDVQLLPCDDVQGGERFVQDEEVRLCHERAGKLDPLLHSPGKLRRRGRLRAEQPELVEHLEGPLADLGRDRLSAQLEREQDVPQGVPPGKKSVVLENEGDPLRVDRQGPRHGPVDACNEVEQGGLPAAGRPQERDELLTLHGERNGVYDELVLEAEREA